MAEKTINTNGVALYNALKGLTEPIAYAELANKAGVKAQTGYLTAARKLANADKLDIVKVTKAVDVTIKTITIYPNGLEIEKVATKKVDGYVLAPMKEAE